MFVWLFFSIIVVWYSYIWYRILTTKRRAGVVGAFTNVKYSKTDIIVVSAIMMSIILVCFVL